MSETRVVHVHDKIEGAIYIGRAMPRQGLKASPFANPWKIGAKASHWGQKDPITRNGALFAYTVELILEREGTLRHLLTDLPSLRGTPLACWCRHDGTPMTSDNMCHGDLLILYLDTWDDETLIRMATGWREWDD